MEKLPRSENPIFLFWKLLWTFAFSTCILAFIIGFFSLNTGLTGMTPPMIYVVVMLGIAAGLPLYMLPSYFAYRKALPARRKLLLCNLLLGWTLAGYIACAVKVSHK